MTENRRCPASCIRDGVGYDLAFAKESVGEGWHAILERLFAAKPDWIKVTQVKEKFGGLRFYLDDGTVRMDLIGVGGRLSFEEPANADGGGSEQAAQLEAFRALVREAESESYTICERCGAPAKSESDQWIVTLCQTCRDQRRAEQAARWGPDDNGTDGT